MNREIYQLDENGFISEIHLGSFDEDGKLIDPIFNDEVILCLTTLPQPLLYHKPKWDGEKWTEGATQEEIDEITKVDPLPPTHEERIKELETIVNLLLMGGL